MRSLTATHLEWALMLFSGPMVAVLLEYPRFVAALGLAGWWVSILVSVAVVTGLAWCLAAMMERYPGQDLVDVARTRFGQLSWLVLLPVLLMLATSGVVILRGLVEIAMGSLLPNVSGFWIIVAALIPTTYLAANGPGGIGRFAEIYMILIAGPLLVIIWVSSFAHVQILYLEPWLKWPHGLPLSSAFAESLTFFFGLPAIPFFTGHLSPNRGYLRPLLWAGLLSVFFLELITTAIFGTLGPAASSLALPGVFWVNTLWSPLVFVQQLASPTLALWAPFFFTAASIPLWAAGYGCAKLAGSPQPLYFIIATALLLALGTMKLFPYVTFQVLFPLWALGMGGAYVWMVMWFGLARPHSEDAAVHAS